MSFTSDPCGEPVGGRLVQMSFTSDPCEEPVGGLLHNEACSGQHRNAGQMDRPLRYNLNQC